MKLLGRSLVLACIAGIALLASCTEPSEVTLEAETSTSIPRPQMPDVKCMTLQDAQDLIQDQGVFFSRSNDASGRNRNPVVDSNWIVIDQTPEPGTSFGEGDAVLSVLKVDEASVSGLC